MERLAGGSEEKVTDPTNAPGPKVLVAGNRKRGFYGFVQPWEFGEIEGNPQGRTSFDGSNLALAIGLTAGTAQFIDTPWMKFSIDGDIAFVPLKPIRYSAPWNSIYNQGAVYGDDTIGVNPPNGRAGIRLYVDGATNSFRQDSRADGDGFLKSGAVIAEVGDKIITRNFENAANNGEFTVQSITDSAITVSESLVSEEKGNPKANIYNKVDAVTQSRKIRTGGNEYRVRLLKGASQDPLNSYLDADRDMVGDANEWNTLILPMHERAKAGTWNYKAYAGEVDYWSLDLTDKDLHTHHSYGRGTYAWTQETSDDVSWTRVRRGHGGASGALQDFSWPAWNDHGWRPALLLSVSQAGTKVQA